jgi:CheY-like chemotaxis protein
VVGKGSAFTLYLPLDIETVPRRPERREGAPQPTGGFATAGDETSELVAVFSTESMGDDAASLQKGDRILLVVEDDPTFARIMVDAGHERGFKCLVASRGAQAVSLARHFHPHAITLDIRLPDIDGWRVLDILKSDPVTRHIPLLVVSASDEPLRGMRLGAVAHLTKPTDAASIHEAIGRLSNLVGRGSRRLLIVENDNTQQRHIVDLIGNGDVVTATASSGQEGLAQLSAEPVDCVILDPELPDMSVADFLEQVRDGGNPHLPIVVYPRAGEASPDDPQFRAIAESAVIKNARSPEGLLDETMRFLHRPTERLPEAQRKLIEKLHDIDAVLGGRKVLVVDDDARNLFALTSLLERHGMQVTTAETGMEALDILSGKRDVDAVLMDIMMPDMDGYETIRRIRQSSKHAGLPIVALTAKAMKGDRERCVEAGASDYIAKPADPEQLLLTLRIWLTS